MTDGISGAIAKFEVRCLAAEKNLASMPSFSLNPMEAADDTKSAARELAHEWSEGHKYIATQELPGLITALSNILDAASKTYKTHYRERPELLPMFEPTIDKSHSESLIRDTRRKVSELMPAIQSEVPNEIKTSQDGLQQRLARLVRYQEALDCASRFDSSYDLDSHFAVYKDRHQEAWESLTGKEQAKVNAWLTKTKEKAQKQMSTVLPQFTGPALDSQEAKTKSRQVNLLVLQNWATWLRTSREYRKSVTGDFAKKNVILQF